MGLRSSRPKADLWIGPFRVDSFKSVLERNGRRRRVEPKAMRVLLHLAGRPGEDVAREEILRAVWEVLP